MEKLAIIGGSLAGLELARALKDLDEHSDFEIHLFEEHPTIGLPLKCAEGFIAFHDIPGPDPNFILNEINSVVVRFIDEELRILDSVHIPTEGKAWVINRPRNEQHLAAACAKRGVIINLGHRVSIREISSSFDFIVDASGCPSEYARLSERRTRPPSVGIGGTIRGDFTAFQHLMLIDFTPLLSRYFWIFPKTKALGNVGLGWHSSGSQPSKPKALLNRYLDTMLGHWHLEQWVAGCVGTELSDTLYDPAQRVALLGDAAGLANPLVGEGMSNAILSARTLASCLAADDVPSYPRLITNMIGSSYMSSLLGRHVLEKLGYEMFEKLFHSIRNPSLELLHMSSKRLLAKLAPHPFVLAEFAGSYLRYRIRKALGKRPFAHWSLPS